MNSTLVRILRHACACSLALAVILVPPARAAEGDDDTATLDKVEVTGSRIKRVQVEGANPIINVSREQIDKSGLSSIGEFIQQLTASGSALNTKFNSSGNFGFPPDGGGVGAGSAQVDLRHLDAKRVLVLVDGKRWVNESSASGVGGAVDLNTIPLSIVQRIEVLLDGASTVYGSDAISGVINVITRNDFDGMELRATAGSNINEGDGETETVELSMGKSDSKSSLFLSLSYNDIGQVNSSDREQSLEPVPGTGLTRGSSATPQGRFVFDNTGAADPTGSGLCPGNICDITTPNGATFGGGVPTFPGDFVAFDTPLRFNYQPYNLILTPSERTSAFLQGTYALTDSVTYYAKFLYNTRNSLNRAAPEPIFLGSDAGNGNIGDHVVIDVTNPYNPFGITLDADAGNAFFLTRRPLEGGPRFYEQNVNTYYFGTGLEGSLDLFDRSWDWDLNYIYSRNQAVQETRGTYNMAHIVKGLGPLATCNADPSCVPINFFGGAAGNTLTPDMLDYILAVLHDTSEQEMRIYSANASGTLMAVPAGDVGVAFGYEHRQLEGSYTPDHLSSSGEANGVPSGPTGPGGYTVDELYGEFVVPLLSEVKLAQLLELEASVRFSDYSTSGSTSTTKFGGRWQVNDELLIRGTWAEGFRAPSIGELYASPSRFDATITDPCSGLNEAVPGPDATDTPLEIDCRALGVPIDGSYTQLNTQISVLTGGNIALDPETSTSFTWGVVYEPEWARNLPVTQSLVVTLDVYDYTVEGNIGAIDAQTQLDGCVTPLGTSPGINPNLCNGITRSVNGPIINFDNFLKNLGSIDTSGFDLNLVWRLEETSIGSFLVTWNNSFVKEYVTTDDIAGTIIITELAGVERNDSAIPEWTSNLIVDWSRAKWIASWSVRLIDGVTEACTDDFYSTSGSPSPDSLTNLGLCSIPDPNGDLDDRDSLNRLATTIYHDVQVGYQVGDLGGMDTTIKFGINNLFDKDPPICRSCSLNGYDASTYDMPGSRFVYVAFEGRFD